MCCRIVAGTLLPGHSDGAPAFTNPTTTTTSLTSSAYLSQVKFNYTPIIYPYTMHVRQVGGRVDLRVFKVFRPVWPVRHIANLWQINQISAKGYSQGNWKYLYIFWYKIICDYRTLFYFYSCRLKFKNLFKKILLPYSRTRIQNFLFTNSKLRFYYTSVLNFIFFSRVYNAYKFSIVYKIVIKNTNIAKFFCFLGFTQN